ncbi:MAG: hypothetical protein RJA76_1656 [Bacteroidota bacterium]|jgi:lysozyme
MFKAKRYILICLLAFLFSCDNQDNPNRFVYSETAKIKLPTQHEIHGIDLSHYNGSINWKKLPNIQLFDTVSIKFIYFKATEGRQLVDQDFKKNWEEAKNRGFVRGAYHFFVPNRDPIEQAENFCSTVILKEGDLPPVCDFESSTSIPKDKLKKNIRIFLDKLQDNYGIQPIIYTNKKLYHKIFEEDFQNYQYWIAHYGSQKYDESIDNLLFWQHNKDGKLPGHKGNFDYNVFLGDEEDFRFIQKNKYVKHD